MPDEVQKPLSAEEKFKKLEESDKQKREKKQEDNLSIRPTLRCITKLTNK